MTWVVEHGTFGSLAYLGHCWFFAGLTIARCSRDKKRLIRAYELEGCDGDGIHVSDEDRNYFDDCEAIGERYKSRAK